MRRAFALAFCSASLACSSSTTNEAAGGSAGASGGSGGVAGSGGGGTGGSGGGPTCSATSDGFDCAPNHPTSMAVDDAAVYWAVRDGAGDEYLFRVEKASTAASVSAWAKIGSVSKVGDLLADGNYAYVATTSGARQLLRYAIPAGTESVVVNQDKCAQAYSRAPLAMDGFGVYFPCNSTQDFVAMVEKVSASISVVFSYPVNVTIHGLASNESVLAVAMDDLDTIPLPSGSAGLVQAAGGFTRVGIVGNVIYAQNASAVTTHNIGGGAGNDALTNVTGIIDFRADATGIYAITGDALVGKKLGAVGHTVIQSSISPGGIALDATHVFWAETSGKVRRAERKAVTP